MLLDLPVDASGSTSYKAASEDGVWSSIPVSMPAQEAASCSVSCTRRALFVVAFEISRWSPRWAVEEPLVWLFEVPAGPKGLSARRTATRPPQDLIFKGPLQESFRTRFWIPLLVSPESWILFSPCCSPLALLYCSSGSLTTVLILLCA
jgi:hypothetical protein